MNVQIYAKVVRKSIKEYSSGKKDAQLGKSFQK